MESNKQERKKPSGATRGKLIIVAVVLVAFIANPFSLLFLYTYGIIPSLEGRMRTSISYTHETLRSLAYYAERDFAIPSETYFGPITYPLLEEMAKQSRYPEYLKRFGEREADWAIDPFNRNATEKEWRRGPRFFTDRGVKLRIRGLNYHYYSDGAKFYILISCGPDGDLDLTKDIIESVKNKSHDDRDIALTAWRYDPSNGTVSGGDIYRCCESQE